MVSARVKHRDYVPSGWIAVTFCHVEFLGPDAKSFERLWQERSLARFKAFEGEKKKIAIDKQKLIDLKNQHSENLKKSKPFWRFWYNKAENELISEIDKLNEKIENQNKELEKLDDNYHDTHTNKKLIEDFLSDNGFILVSSTAAGEECVTYTDIWNAK